MAVGLGVPARAAPAACTPRLLVLSAFPAELDAVLAHAGLRPHRAVSDGTGHTFYLGQLRHGPRVVFGLTGIGPVNARRTTEAALDRFRCGTASAISAVVFSGVAGSTRFIGDVTVPRRWSDDDGQSWIGVDPAMFAVAQQLAGRVVPLEQDNPAPNVLCACDLRSIATVHLPQPPEVVVGGDGITTDPLGGRALPCAPFGGDIFGCRVCRAGPAPTPDPLGFLIGALPFADPAFVAGYLAAPESSSSAAIAADNETATVGRVATARGIPFIGFRGVSDGAGDPLMLPGFPVQFFTYYRVAADNAAATAVAFLHRWPT